MKARVFVSCGQRKGTLEAEIATRVEKTLIGAGFDPYVAIAESTPRGLQENLFERLRESEYFLFIDFRRDRRRDFPVSLFSHQELAVAAFLEKRVIPFHQKGVKRGGFITAMQLNSQEFETVDDLIKKLRRRVRREWVNDWRDELILQVAGCAMETHGDKPVRYWFLQATNQNLFTTALNCCAYLRRQIALESKQELPPKTVEYKWTGVTNPYVMIPPTRSRKFDAFVMYPNTPFCLHTMRLTDSTTNFDDRLTPGSYLLRFAIHSENFHEAEGDFVVSFDGRGIESVKLRAATENESEIFDQIPAKGL